MTDEVKVESKGWKTKTAGILTGVYALVGLGLYFISGHDVVGALPPAQAIPLLLGGFGLVGLGDKVQKLIDAIKK